MKEPESLFRKHQNVPIENYKKGLFRNINPTLKVNKQTADEATNHTAHLTISGFVLDEKLQRYASNFTIFLE